MAADGVNTLKLQIVHGQEKRELCLTLPSEEAGELLTVHHLKADIDRLYDIPPDCQKLIFKGKSLSNSADSLVKQGLKNGSKVMLIGKKPPPVDDARLKKLKSVDSSLDSLETKLSEITYELDGIHRGYLQKDLKASALDKLRNQLGALSEQFMKMLEALDALHFEEDNKGARIKRKNLVDRIQTLLDRADGLTRDAAKANIVKFSPDTFQFSGMKLISLISDGHPVSPKQDLKKVTAITEMEPPDLTELQSLISYGHPVSSKPDLKKVTAITDMEPNLA
ncbi:hypothetical protein ScPMuIL_003197 [Solemya velum]